MPGPVNGSGNPAPLPWKGCTQMITNSTTSKAVLATVLISALLAGGCSRRQPVEGQASSGSSATDTTTASRASGASDTGTSSGSSNASDTSGTSGSSGTSGTGPAAKAGMAIDDSVITTKIKSSILSDSSIKGSDISVDTKNGEVTLTGSVKNQTQMDRAQKLAQNTDGVKGVNNKLAVKP
jgi:hyperosmotically inducible protein